MLYVMSSIKQQWIIRPDNAIVRAGYPVLHYVPRVLLNVPWGVVDLKVQCYELTAANISGECFPLW
jgi:hypothetical protein